MSKDAAPVRRANNSSTQRVDLPSGGHIVLSITVDLFALTQEDRKFICDLVDGVNQYLATLPGPKPEVTPRDAGSDAGQGGGA